ncbi:MAG: hypothetical protein ACHQIG_02205 [Acidimicrobiia bacterium]
MHRQLRPLAPRLSPARPALALVLLLGAEASGVAALVRLGTSAPFDVSLDPDAWGRAAPVDALAAALRWVALVAAAWLLAVTLASVAATAIAARQLRRGGRVAPAARVAPRAIRHLVERALVGGLAIGVVALPAAAHAATRTDPPVVKVVRDGRAGDITSLPGSAPPTAPPPAVAVATPAEPPVAGPLVPDSPTPPRAPVERDTTSATRAVVVAPGEHLWELAAREVARSQGVVRDAVADVDVAPYWVTVCDLNRDRLASGDVNVVEVGETVLLPPLT